MKHGLAPRQTTPPRGEPQRHGLTLGNLPRGAGYVVRACKSLRLALERAVLDERDEISVLDAAFINTAARWEKYALLALRWLRNEWDDLTPTERLQVAQDLIDTAWALRRHET